MRHPDNIVCPACRSPFGSHAHAPAGGDALACSHCDKSYPVTGGIVDFRIAQETSADLGWSAEDFEKMYETLEDWDSIYDWDERQGIPREASDYKYARVKGMITDMMEPRAGGRILDLGCGNGYFLMDIHRHFSPRVPDQAYIGIDASMHNMVRFEKKRRSREATNVYPILGTGEHLPFDSNSVDVIVSSEVLEHIADKEAAIAEAHRVLVPGGTLLFTTPSSSAMRNWYLALWPLRMARRLSQLRLRRIGEPGHYDHPITKQAYAAILKRLAFAEFSLRSSQMLNDEIFTYLPRFLRSPYIGTTRFLESNSSLMRSLFGLHLIGFARK